MDEDRREAWHRQRQRSIVTHAAALREYQAGRAAKAEELVAWFTREAHRRQLGVTALSAQASNGRGRVRTRLRGWYLQPDRYLAIDTEGRFYVLTAPASLWSRLVGTTILPETPRLVIGEGGRDGESIALEILLQRRLDAGDHWP